MDRIHIHRVLIMCLFLLLNIAGGLQSQTLNISDNTLPSIVTSMTNFNRANLKGFDSGWARWRIKNKPWDEIVAVAADSQSGFANLIMALHDTRTYSIMLSNQKNKYYQYYQGPLASKTNWRLTALATRDNGQVDRLIFTLSDRKRMVIGDKNLDGKPDYIALPIGMKRWVILTFNKSGSNFNSTYIYDPTISSYVAFCNYAVSISKLKEVFVKSEKSKWIEYVYNENKVTAVAVHDSVAGLLSFALFDLDSDGFVDAMLKKSNSKEGTKIVTPAKQISVDKLSSSDYSSILISTSKTATDLWKIVKPILVESKAMGYRFPEIKPLPKKN